MRRLPHMRPTTAKTNDEGEPPDTESFAWPPSDDVLQKMAVIDFVTGETRPLKLDPPPKPDSEPVTVSEEPPVAPAVQDAARPVVVPVRRRAKPSVRTQWLLACVALLAIAAGAFIAWRVLRQPGSALPATVSTPVQPGNAPAGVTAPPATSPAAPAGTPLARPEPQPATKSSGSVVVRTDTAGARVWIDGVYRGRTPLSAGELAAGTHTVAVEGPAGRIQQSIAVEPGAAATFFASTGAAVSGGIAVTAPSEIEVREGGRVIGTSRAERILLEPGRHTLDFVNETLGYESRQVVDVVPGKILPIAMQFPNGTLNINALPWAEVLVDGQRVGNTPIGNLPVRVGSHEITFRHPELGEMKRTVDVTLRGPARVSVNLERKEP